MRPFWHRSRDAPAWKPGIPDFDAERCILGGAVNAQCTRCADACPELAIVQNDEMLGIDTDACTGCGLCLPACPQSAVSLGESLPVRGNTALAVCMQSAFPNRATIGCVHGLDHAALADLHDVGIRLIELHTGDCAECPYGNGQRLEGTLADLNRIFEDRGLGRIQAVRRPELPADNTFSRSAGEEPVNRRRRGLLLGQAGTAIGDTTPSRSRRSGLRTLLARPAMNSGETPLQLVAPQIDTQKCTGCDLCIRVCPEGSLTLLKAQDEQLCYAVKPSSCTGCGLCVDVCETGAIELNAMAQAEARRIPLATARCRACGVQYHRPNELPETGGLCPTCARTGHHAKLFQVI